MRRHDRNSKSDWLCHLDGEKGEGRIAPTIPLLDSPAELLRRINRKHGYMITLWQEDDAIRAWLHPLPGRLPDGQPPVSVSYSATDLHRLLIAAVIDLAALYRGELRYKTSTQEHVRWVA